MKDKQTGLTVNQTVEQIEQNRLQPVLEVLDMNHMLNQKQKEDDKFLKRLQRSRKTLYMHALRDMCLINQ